MKKKYLFIPVAVLMLILLGSIVLQKNSTETANLISANTVSENEVSTNSVSANSDIWRLSEHEEQVPQSECSEEENIQETEADTGATHKTKGVTGENPQEGFQAMADSWREPVSGLSTREEIDWYAGEILYDIVCHPDRMEEYSKILTSGSFWVFNHLQICYVNPEYAWQIGWTDVEQEEKYIECETTFEPDWGTLDEEKLILDKDADKLIVEESKGYIWKIRIWYRYEKDTGLISIWQAIERPSSPSRLSRRGRKYSCPRCTE